MIYKLKKSILALCIILLANTKNDSRFAFFKKE